MSNKTAEVHKDLAKLANEKHPESLSAITLFDVKQARAAVANARQIPLSDQHVADSELEQFLTTLGANIFANASNFQTKVVNVASLLAISDKRMLAPANKKVRRLRPLPSYVTEMSVPSHVVPKRQATYAGQNERSRDIVQTQRLVEIRENAEKMRMETRINIQKRFLSRLQARGSLATRVNREKEMFLQSVMTRRLLEDRLSAIKSNVKIVVVGAGLAGLSAADKLLSLGFSNVIVLEASDRVGGRIHSVPYRDPPFDHLEMGVAYVDHANEDNSVYAWIKHLGLEEQNLTPSRAESAVLCDNGLLASANILPYLSLPCKLVQKDSSMIYSQIKSHCYGNINLPYNDYIRERHRRFVKSDNHATGEQQAIIAQIVDKLAFPCKYQFGDNYGNLAVNLLGLCKEKGISKVSLPTGMCSMLDPLTNQLKPDKLYLNARVQKVEWHASTNKDYFNCQITCCNGRIFHAHHVIIAIPVGHLKETADKMFVPNLPAEKMDAIKRVGFGTITKVYLCYKAPFWQKPVDFIWLGSENTNEKLSSQTLKFTSITFHPKILEVSMLGNTAETMPESDIIQQLTAILRLYFSDAVPQPVQVQKTGWYENPLFRGTHPYLSTQCSEKDQSTLEKPLMLGDSPVVLFAGDYTHNNYSCLIHAARASGLREAHRLLNLYNTLDSLENTNP